LLAESLGLRRQLPGEVDELVVARDLVDQRRKVRLLLTDAVTRDRHALGPQLRLNRVGKAGAVRLLVVDDVDPLYLQRSGHVLHGALALVVVGRHRPEEVTPAGPVRCDRGVRRRARDEAEARTL